MIQKNSTVGRRGTRNRPSVPVPKKRPDRQADRRAVDQFTVTTPTSCSETSTATLVSDHLLTFSSPLSRGTTTLASTLPPSHQTTKQAVNPAPSLPLVVEGNAWTQKNVAHRSTHATSLYIVTPALYSQLKHDIRKKKATYKTTRLIYLPPILLKSLGPWRTKQ